MLLIHVCGNADAGLFFCLFFKILTSLAALGFSCQDTGSLVVVVGALLPWGIWDLSSLTKDGAHIPWVARQMLNHWTTKEVLRWSYEKGLGCLSWALKDLFDFSRYQMRREGHFIWKEVYMQGAGPILRRECERRSRKGGRGRLKQSLSVSLNSILQTEPSECAEQGIIWGDFILGE